MGGPELAQDEAVDRGEVQPHGLPIDDLGPGRPVDVEVGARRVGCLPAELLGHGPLERAGVEGRPLGEALVAQVHLEGAVVEPAVRVMAAGRILPPLVTRTASSTVL